MKPLLTLVSVLAICKSEPCELDKYEPCVTMAKPLLTQAHLVFPDNKRDIDVMCKTWKRFEDCTNNYTNHCFTENQQEEFKKAVETPVVNVHRMCSEQQYQQEYLQHAACIQSTITREGYCSPHYRRLLDQVMGENEQAKLCCFHNHFRECVLSQTRERCTSGNDPDSAVIFSQQILDKALSFLYSQCSNYPLSPEECMPPPSPKMDNSVKMNDYSTTGPFVQQRSTDEMIQARWPSTGGSSAMPYFPGWSPSSSYQSPLWTPGSTFSSYQRSPSFGSETTGTSSSSSSSGGVGGSSSNAGSQQASFSSREATSTWRVFSGNPTTPAAWYPAPAPADDPHQMSLEHGNGRSSRVKLAVTLLLTAITFVAVI